MSISHSISIQIKLKHSKENILSILKNGEDIGCIYFERGPEDIRNYQTINASRAAELVWSRYINNYEFGPLLFVQYKNTQLDIWFYKANEHLDIYLGTSCYTWRKDFENDYNINFQRYTLFLLKLVREAIIIHFISYTQFYGSYDSSSLRQDHKICIDFSLLREQNLRHIFEKGHNLNIMWLDADKCPIKELNNLIQDLINIQFNRNIPDGTNIIWYAKKDKLTLQFSIQKDCMWIIEPCAPCITIFDLESQEEYLDLKPYLALIIKLFRHMAYSTFITFSDDQELIAIKTMHDD